MLIPGLQHRGLTHSIIILTIAFIPAFAIYKKTSIPYFVALAQHILIGDFLTGEGIQLFWPITQAWYGLGVPMASLDNILLEWISFIAAGVVMVATREIRKLFSNDKYNLLLSVPLLTVLLPSVIRFPLVVPSLLLIPHLAYSGIFTASLLILFMFALKHRNKGARVHGQGRHESRIAPESGSAPI